MKRWKWGHFFLVASTIFIGSNIGVGITSYANAQGVKNIHLSSNDNQKIRVVVSSQDSEGVTQQDFNLNFLKNLEIYTVERIKIKANEYLNSQGHPYSNFNIKSEAVYIENHTTKLAVIRLNAAEGSNQVFIVGIVGNELKRIVCARNSTERIPISYGVCADTIKEVFDFQIGS